MVLEKNKRLTFFYFTTTTTPAPTTMMMTTNTCNYKNYKVINTKINELMLFAEVITIFFENHMEHINIL
jgi:hypothetical protein